LSEFLRDLLVHKAWVARYMDRVASHLFKRAVVHDYSKFEAEEFEPYDKAFPQFQKYAYGTPELAAVYESIKPALAHHYQANDHHPEHFENGINDMNLIQLVEMVCDWMAASKRSQTGMAQGLHINKERFGISDQLYEVICNTVAYLDKEGS